MTAMLDYQTKGCGPYGANMGRRSDLDQDTTLPLHIRRVPMEDGYDTGGAYWGTPDNLFCAWDDEGHVRYLRAASIEAARAEFPNASWVPESGPTEADLADMLDGYISAALFSSNDESRPNRASYSRLHTTSRGGKHYPRRCTRLTMGTRRSKEGVYVNPADLIALARAAGYAGQTWADWQCSDDVQAFADSDGFDGRPGRLLIQACEKAFKEGVREHRINGGWVVAWTTAPADYDSMGTETIPTADGAATEGDYHGKPLRRVMMDPKHAGYQADRYSSGFHPTWKEDPRILDAAAAERAAKILADEKTRRASRDRGREWLKRATDDELEAADVTTEDEHGFFTSDLRDERGRRQIAADDATRAAEWARCTAIVPEGCTIVDRGCDARRGEFGAIPGRPTHVYYNVRIVHGWPDDTEHANVMGESNRGPWDNAGSLAYVADWLTKGEADGFTKKLEIVPADSVPPRPVLERIGHEHLKDIRRVEATGRLVWVGRPSFGEPIVLDEKGHIVRARKVLEAIETSGVARDL